MNDVISERTGSAPPVEPQSGALRHGWSGRRPAPAIVPPIAIEAMMGRIGMSNGGDIAAGFGCGEVERGPMLDPSADPNAAFRPHPSEPRGSRPASRAHRIPNIPLRATPERNGEEMAGTVEAGRYTPEPADTAGRDGKEHERSRQEVAWHNARWPNAQDIDLDAIIKGKAGRPPWWPSFLEWPHPTFREEFHRLRRERIALLEEIEARGSPVRPVVDQPGFRDDSLLSRQMKLDSDIGTLQAAVQLQADAMIARAVALDRSFLAQGMLPLETSVTWPQREPIRHLDSVTPFMALISGEKEVRESFSANVSLMARDKLMTHDRSLIIAGRGSTAGAGGSLACTKPTRQAMEVMLLEARSRGWPSIMAAGTPEFMAAIAAAGARHGLTVIDRESGRAIQVPSASQEPVASQNLSVDRMSSSVALQDPFKGRAEPADSASTRDFAPPSVHLEESAPEPEPEYGQVNSGKATAGQESSAAAVVNYSGKGLPAASGQADDPEDENGFLDEAERVVASADVDADGSDEAGPARTSSGKLDLSAMMRPAARKAAADEPAP